MSNKELWSDIISTVISYTGSYVVSLCTLLVYYVVNIKFSTYREESPELSSLHHAETKRNTTILNTVLVLSELP